MSETEFPQARAREWLGLATLALPCFIYAMDLGVLNLAIPALSRELQPTSTQLLWIADIYGFMVAGWLVTMGTLGDRIGRRRLLLIGSACFGVASGLAALSRSAEMLILARGLLGIAGATLAPSTLSLIRLMFQDPAQRTMAIGIWASSFSVGGAVGPLLGGMLLEYFHWSAVFWLAVPVMGLLLVLGPLLLPEFRNAEAGRLDLGSALLSLGGVLGVIYGLKQTAEQGWTLETLVSGAGGAGLLWLFVRRQRLLAHPMLDLSLFRLPNFKPLLAMAVMAAIAMFAGFFFLAQYLQLVRGLSPLEAGLWSLPAACCFIPSSLLTGRLARVMSPRALIASGCAISAVGAWGMLTLGASTSIGSYLVSTMLYCLGMSPLFILTTDLIMSAAPSERAGATSAISETSFELGGALGIAFLGSLGTWAYRQAMAGADLSAWSTDLQTLARTHFAATLTRTAELPPALGEPLRLLAQQAFLQSWPWVFGAVTLLIVGLCLLALRLRSPHRE